ncbi:MAG: hypothetical protein J1F23_07410 [Oscillospiraceae bacterium]|nr:hypothetical protein [Oscillospiraceae bacterium]
MNKLIKILSPILCVIILLSACNRNVASEEETTAEPPTENISQPVNTETAQGGKISLPYNDTDGLNPYFMKSYENMFIAALLFEPLYEPNSAYEPVPVIAESISVNGTTATVTVKSNAECHGSSPINAYDVVYSFNLAKASYLYGGYLAGVASAAARSAYAVDFTLEYSDALAAGKLTFPIVKEGTADLPEAVPTGSGAYYFLENTLINTANDSKTIELCKTDIRESVENSFKIGLSDVFFSDLSDCNYVGTTGKTEDILLNNMVYIGLNSANGALSRYVRSAIAAAIDSEDIVLSSYQGHAQAAKLPLNPELSAAKELNFVAASGDKALANKIIDQCGYTRYSGRAKTNGAYTLSLNLIVNGDNRYRLAAAYNIADALSQVGFLITVQPLKFEDYSQRIAAGNYDMYLGEVKLDGSMDISRFFTDGTELSEGIDKTERAATEYFRYRAGEISAEEYYAIFAEYYPFVPVCFRKGYVVYSADVSIDSTRLPYNLYYNF